MNLRRDIAWQQIDALHRSSIAYQYDAYGLGLRFEMLPHEVVHQAKRCLLDALGCAIGGHDSPGRPICEATVEELGGVPECTVIGSGLRTNAANANLVNCFQVRFLDFNDLSGGGHNSDSIPALLAIAEREKKGGRDLITSLVISYELAERLNAGVNNWHGWQHDARAGFVVPPAIGRMLGMTTDQIAHAIGTSVAGNSVMGILDAPSEEKTMRKNFRFGWSSTAAIVSTLLARHGFTGPLRVFEGERGMNQILLRGEADLEAMVDFRGWRITNTRFKFLCSSIGLHSILQATLELVREHDIKPEQVEGVLLKTSPSSHAIRATVPIKYPRNAETADHSAYYLTAIAIVDREVDADSILSEKFTDPVILDLIERIRVVAEPSIAEKPKVKFVSNVGFEGRSEITLKDGRVFKNTVMSPKGVWGGPTLTDRELEEKFAKMARKHLSEARIAELFAAIWNIEKLDDIGKLMRLAVF